MKKTLVALAAVAASASYAQVTLSGNLDFAYSSSTGTLTGVANGSTIATGRGTASTSSIKLTAAEDIGGGMKVTAQYELDPRALADDTATQIFAANTTTDTDNSASVASTLKVLGSHEIFVGLSGGFGDLRLGQPNSTALDAHSASSPLGTGIGSGYTANGAGSTNWSKLTSTRYIRSAKYTSPTINGFKVTALYAPGNDQTAAATSTALSVQNNRQVTELGLSYSAGNLNVVYANLQQAKQTNTNGYYGIAGGNYVATNANVLGVNYKFGNLTAYAGMGSGTQITASSAEVTQSQTRYALKYTAGNVDLIGQYTQVESAGQTQKTTGARADYNLSKTAAAYIGYESYDSGSSAANQLNIVSVGLRKSF